MAGLVEHVVQLRTMAILDPDTSTLNMAMINVMEELAEAIEGLRGRVTPPPEDEQGFGSI
jgi:hypothetical protein